MRGQIAVSCIVRLAGIKVHVSMLVISETRPLGFSPLQRADGERFRRAVGMGSGSWRDFRWG